MHYYVKVMGKYFSIMWSLYQAICSNIEAITELKVFLNPSIFSTLNSQWSLVEKEIPLFRTFCGIWRNDTVAKKIELSQTAWAGMLPSVHTRCALSGKFLHMSVSLFDDTDNENNENKYLVHFLWRLNELIDKKCLKQTTAQSKLLINVSFHNGEEGDDN